MAFTLKSFLQIRPYLYHLTARHNLPRIQSQRRLHSAKELMEQAESTSLLRRKREDCCCLTIEEVRVHIRDQRPLYPKNIELDKDWTFEDFVEALNRQIFFWPGKENGPIEYGVRHFKRYASERPIILRVQSVEVFAANPSGVFRFCRFNSGSPRWSGGSPSPRGPNTFLSCDQVDFTPSEVVEVTYEESLKLPSRFEVGDSPQGPWRVL